MPRNYYYIKNLSQKGYLSVAGNIEPGAALVLKSKFDPPNNSQMWYMDEFSNSYIQSVGGNLVLEKQLTGPTGAQWVNLRAPSGNGRQLWSYGANGGLIQNHADGQLDIWGSSNAVICSAGISLEPSAEETLQSEPAREPAQPEPPQSEPSAQEQPPSELTLLVAYYWQLEIAGQKPDEEAPAPETPEQDTPEAA